MHTHVAQMTRRCSVWCKLQLRKCPWLFACFHGESQSPPTQASPAETFCSSTQDTNMHKTHTHAHTRIFRERQPPRENNNRELRKDFIVTLWSISICHFVVCSNLDIYYRLVDKIMCRWWHLEGEISLFKKCTHYIWIFTHPFANFCLT